MYYNENENMKTKKKQKAKINQQIIIKNNRKKITEK